VALDGTTLDVADTPANLAAFGRPGGGRVRGRSCSAAGGAVECGTHAVMDAVMGEVAVALAGAFAGPGILLLADQGLCGLALWRTFQATGAELVWRCRQDVKLEVLEVFEDGSWRGELGHSQPASKRVAVRVVDYRLDDPGRAGEPQGYRLITTILYPALAPAGELPALYPQPAHRAAPGDQPGRVFPLGGWPGRPGRRSLRCCGTCCPHAGCAPGRRWSSAR